MSRDSGDKRVSRRDFLKYLGPAAGLGATGLASGIGYVQESQISSLRADDASLQARLLNIESLSQAEPYGFILYSDAGTPKNYYAKNGNTGEVEIKDTSLISILNYARDHLTSRRTWRETISLKGDFALDAKFSLAAHMELDLRQAKVAASGLNDDMIEAGVEDFAIVGGRLDGTGQTGGSLISVVSGAQRFWIGYGMRLLNAAQEGLHLKGISQSPVGVGTIVDIDVEHCRHDGILLGPFSADNIVSVVNCGANGDFAAGTGSGIEVRSSSDNVVSDILVWNNAAHGLDIFDSSDNSFTNVRADYNYAHGVRLAGGSSKNVLLNLRCHDNGLLNPGGVLDPSGTKYSGIKVEDSSGNLILGGVSQNTVIDPGFGVGFQAFGVDESGSSNLNVIGGIDVGRRAERNNLAGIVRSGVNTRVTDCPGFNPQGIESIAVPDTGLLVYVNRDGVSEAVYIRGGAVNDISKDGTTIFTSTPATVWLEPGESVGVTYSLAPLMFKDRK